MSAEYHNARSSRMPRRRGNLLRAYKRAYGGATRPTRENNRTQSDVRRTKTKRNEIIRGHLIDDGRHKMTKSRASHRARPARTDETCEACEACEACQTVRNLGETNKTCETMQTSETGKDENAENFQNMRNLHERANTTKTCEDHENVRSKSRENVRREIHETVRDLRPGRQTKVCGNDKIIMPESCGNSTTEPG
jgi:hypothetical protein